MTYIAAKAFKDSQKGNYQGAESKEEIIPETSERQRTGKNGENQVSGESHIKYPAVYRRIFD